MTYLEQLKEELSKTNIIGITSWEVSEHQFADNRSLQRISTQRLRWAGWAKTSLKATADIRETLIESYQSTGSMKTHTTK